MKRWLVVAVLGVLPVAMYAQKVGSVTLPAQPPAVTAEVTEIDHPISHSDLYCAGFLSQPLPRDGYIAGALDTPYQTHHTAKNFIFLRGSDYQPGTRVSIVRQTQDPNRYYPFPGEQARQESAGQIYADIGYAVIVERRGTDIAVAQLEFSCQDAVDGDQVVPFVERPPVSYRLRSSMDRFPVAAPVLAGRIVAGRDFDQYLGGGAKVYLNLGASQGLKPGSYLRVVRGYAPQEMDTADMAVYRAPMRDQNQKNAPRLPGPKLKDLPRRVVGEVVVLSTQPTTATAMVSFALEDIHIGDTVELEPAKPR